MLKLQLGRVGTLFDVIHSTNLIKTQVIKFVFDSINNRLIVT